MWCPICKEKGVLNELDNLFFETDRNDYLCDNCGTKFDGKLRVKRENNDNS